MQRFVFADDRRYRGLNIFPCVPASRHPRCVMLKMGAAAVAVGTFFQVLRHRTARGVLF